MALQPGHRRLVPIKGLIIALTMLAGSSYGEVTHFVSLGDSVTFGIDPSTPSSLSPSLGDQGFVSPFADFLAGRHGGDRPTITNLGIPGELSTSFFSGQAPPGWRVPQLNLNYSAENQSQFSLMQSSIQTIQGSGGQADYVSLLIGSNDIFYLVGTPDFQNASAADQQQMIAATLGTVLTNYHTILTELDTLAPNATVFLPGYYSAFPDFLPERALYDSILDVFNPAVQQLSLDFDAHYVDLYSVFDGRELELTNIGVGDVHPNQAGYSAIAGAFSSAIPEPSSMALLGVGSCLVFAARRLKRPAAKNTLGAAA